MALTFSKIEYSDVFTRDFSNFTRNNQINFPTSEQIAVVYGPNGTGKTSLIKVLSDSAQTHVEFNFDGVPYTHGASVFHVINDQNNRNIISGETRDFFLGDNIRHEFELQDQLADRRKNLVTTIISLLKEKGISAARSPLLELLPNTNLKAFLKDCANSKSKGERYTNEQIVSLFSEIAISNAGDYSEEKLNFLISDFGKKTAVIFLIEKLSGETVVPNAHVREIEENTEAISILSRFHKNQCIVCDNENIDWEALLSSKTENRDAVKQTLEPKVKEVLEQITDLSLANDPFNLKHRLLDTIESGNMQIVTDIVTEIQECKQQYITLLRNILRDAYDSSGFEPIYQEYQQLVATAPAITDEDYLYIQEIIANSMSKPLTVERDENKRLRIRLSNQEFLGKDREELPLSTGEQNFLSLTFEFLKAKNSTCPVVVIDDPVSSFDSIYKNKVVYAIVKILHHKKRIVLTHNTDLIRLLDGQYNHCFKLYLLNSNFALE
jgi:ABC-type lipoprotein export system ATPase subunit